MPMPYHDYPCQPQDHRFHQTRLCNLRKIEALPVTSVEIRAATQQDPILSKVKRYVL